jgi:hypothetical protein
MPNFTAGTSFTDGVTNDVTAAKLNALVADAVPTSSLALASTSGTISNFTSSTATLLGAITGSTNVINIGSGQIYKDASGQVGIGTTSPATKLHVLTANPTSANEVARFQGGNNASNFRNYISLYTTNPSYWWELSNQDPDGAGASNGIAFRERSNTASVERLYIAQGGNVGIGTVSPSCKLNVETSAVSEVVRFESKASGDVANSILNIVKKDNDNTTSQLFVQFLINGFANGSGRINANGANAAAFGSYSDSRLKENITALPSQLANICLLKPSEFDYKNGSGHQIGFIAQEMQEVYPDCVGVGDDGMLTITAWSKTEARLVKAIQELKSENDSLKSRIEALEVA